MEHNHMGGTIWEKKMVYVVTIWLKEEDAQGEPINWSSPSEEYYADTLEEAEQMKERFLSGRNEYYGDLVEDVWISDEKEEREFLKPIFPSVQEEQRSSILQKLTDNKRQVADRNTSDISKSSEQTIDRGDRQRSEAR